MGYTIGIVSTFAVMVYYQHPQPALLFLVPSCTFSVLLCALVKGDLKGCFSWEEAAIRDSIKAKLKE